MMRLMTGYRHGCGDMLIKETKKNIYIYMFYTIKEADFDSHGLKDMRWKHVLSSLSGPATAAWVSSSSD